MRHVLGAFEQVAGRVVAWVQEQVGAGHLLSKADIGPTLALGAAVSMRGSGEIGCADIGRVAPQQVFGARPVGPGRIAEDAVEPAAASGTRSSGERILIVVLFALGDEPRRGVD